MTDKDLIKEMLELLTEILSDYDCEEKQTDWRLMLIHVPISRNVAKEIRAVLAKAKEVTHD